MGSVEANTGTSGRLILDVNEIGVNTAENYSDVSWSLHLYERAEQNSSWSANPIAATVGEHNVEQWWGGGFTFDWRSGGQQNTLIASGTNRVYHDADGGKDLTVGANIAYTGSTGAGGPTTITSTISLTTIRRVPGTPSNVTATRISDTQVKLDWDATDASNGTANQTVIEWNINETTWGVKVTLGNPRSATVSSNPNQKIRYRIYRANSAGATSQAYSNFVYTTPAAPDSVTAVKNSSLNIVVGFKSNVAYSEHVHQVWHGTVANGVTTWDAAVLATLPSGTSSYTHVAPDPAKAHVYRVRAVANTLSSGYAASSSIQVLAAPNKPSVPAMSAGANKDAALVLSWVHNPVDTTPQQAYEVSYSSNGGTTWSSTGKVASDSSSHNIPANSYAANVALISRVRTWGSATTGGSDGTGASPWSDLRTVTFKTIPVSTITSPVNGSVVNDSTLRVNTTFSQVEGATFVKSQVQLMQNSVLLEALDSTVQVGITLSSVLQNGAAYTVRTRVQDSNGLWSTWASSDFTVVYLAPVTPEVSVSYLEDGGFSQIDLVIPTQVAGAADAVTVSVTRTIDGSRDEIVDRYPLEEDGTLSIIPDYYVVESAAPTLSSTGETVISDYAVQFNMSFLDTTPTIHGTNTYTITTTSALGAQTSVNVDLVTEECRRAFLSKGEGYTTLVTFGGNLTVDEALSVASDTVQAAGRTKPIGLYGVETETTLKVKSFIFEGFGSSMGQLRTFLLIPGKACYRDASGRRVFGSVVGSMSYSKSTQGNLSFTITETS